jgi:hypothetical protein
LLLKKGGWHLVWKHLCASLDKPALVPAAVVGLQELWESGSWQQMVGQDGFSSSSSGSSSGSPVLQCPKLDHAAMAEPGAGVKRGLLEALLQLSMPQEVGSGMDCCAVVCCTVVCHTCWILLCPAAVYVLSSFDMCCPEEHALKTPSAQICCVV